MTWDVRAGRRGWSVWLVALLIVAALSGCGGGASSGPAGDVGLSAGERESLRERAIAELRRATTSADAQTRANAYELLAESPSLLREVAGAGLLDANLGVRSIAAVAVGQAEVRGHENALRVMLADESDYARASAIFALVRLGEEVDRSPLARFLLEGEPIGLRGHTAFLLGELGDPSAIGLLKSAAASPMERASPVEQRLIELQLAEAMIKLGEPGQLGTVRAALFPSQPSDLEAMALAIQIVGEVGDRRSRGRLVQISETSDSAGQVMPAEVQLAVAISMAKLGDRNGWFLAEQFWDSPREVVRADAAAAFGWIGREQDLARLAEMLDDRSGRVRVNAAGAILRSLRLRDGSGRG